MSGKTARPVRGRRRGRFAGGAGRGDDALLHERYAAAVVHACRLLTDAQQPPNLDDLARTVGYSRFHFHRVFKALVGVTPHAFLAAGRAQRVREQLARTEKVSDAIYNSGFNSNGHFYASIPEILGMTPTSFRAGGRGERIRPVLAHCSLGPVVVATAGRNVCAVLLGADAGTLQSRLLRRFPQAEMSAPDAVLHQVVVAAVRRAELPEQSLRLLPEQVRLTAYQARIRQELRTPLSWAADDREDAAG